MPSQIVLHEHIYSDDKNNGNAKPRVLISNRSRKAVTLPHILYWGERYTTDKYSITYNISKRNAEQKTRSVRFPHSSAKSDGRLILKRPSSAVGRRSTLSEVSEEMLEGHEQGASQDCVHLYDVPLFQNKDNHNNSCKDLSYSTKHLQLMRASSAPSTSSRGAMDLMQNESAQPATALMESVTNDSHSHSQLALVAEYLDTYLMPEYSFSNEEHSSLKNLSPDNQSFQHNTCADVDLSTDIIALPSSKASHVYPTSANARLSHRYASLSALTRREACQNRGTSESSGHYSKSTPVQSEIIRGTIYSFEKQCLPESANDSFSIQPLQHHAFSNTISCLDDISESNSSANLATPFSFLPEDHSSEQNFDILGQQSCKIHVSRLSYNTPASPTVSPSSASMRPLTLSRKQSPKAMTCVHPPFMIQPSMASSQLLSLHDQDIVSSKQPISFKDWEDYVTTLNSVNIKSNLQPGFRRAYTCHRTFGPVKPPALRSTSLSPRCQRRDPKSTLPVLQLGASANLIVHSLEVIDPIVPGVEIVKASTYFDLTKEVCISNELQVDTNPQVVASNVPPPQQQNFRMGISRYPPKLRDFIIKSTSDHKQNKQRPRTRDTLPPLNDSNIKVPRLQTKRLKFQSLHPVSQPLGPLRSQSANIHPDTDAELQPLSSLSTGALKLLHNTPMTVVQSSSAQKSIQLFSPYLLPHVKVFPDDCSVSQTSLHTLEYPTPTQQIHSVYAPIQLPNNEERVSKLCEIISARTPVLTTRELQDMKRILLNTAHDSSLSPYAQRRIDADKKSYITRLFDDLKKEASMRRMYHIDRIKRGLNMELYKRIKHSEGDAIVHKIRGIHPDTDSSAPDGFEPPDLREITITSSPENDVVTTEQNIRLVKAFVHSPLSSTLESSSPNAFLQSNSDDLKAETENIHLKNPSGSDLTSNPIIGTRRYYSAVSCGITPNTLDTYPSSSIIRPKLSSISKSSKQCVMQECTSRDRHIPSSTRAAHSAPMQITRHDSALTKILKVELNKQKPGIEMVRPATLASFRFRGIGQDTCLGKVLNTPTAEAAQPPALKDSDTCPHSNTAGIKNREYYTKINPNYYNDHITPTRPKPQTNSGRLRSILRDTQACAATAQPIKRSTHRKSHNLLEDSVATFQQRDSATQGNTAVDIVIARSRKAGRQFYKTAIIDKDVGRVYQKYMNDTKPRARSSKATKINLERLLSRPLTLQGEIIAKQIEAYQESIEKPVAIASTAITE